MTKTKKQRTLNELEIKEKFPQCEGASKKNPQIRSYLMVEQLKLSP